MDSSKKQAIEKYSCQNIEYRNRKGLHNNQPYYCHKDYCHFCNPCDPPKVQKILKN